MLALLVAGSCDVHEFPHNGSEEPGKVPFVLYLDFSKTMEMGFHKEIDYTTQNSGAFQSLAVPASYDVRYSVQAYRVAADGSTATTPDTVITETKSDITDLNHSMVLRLAPEPTNSWCGPTMWPTPQWPTSITVWPISRK